MTEGHVFKAEAHVCAVLQFVSSKGILLPGASNVLKALNLFVGFSNAVNTYPQPDIVNTLGREH